MEQMARKTQTLAFRGHLRGPWSVFQQSLEDVPTSQQSNGYVGMADSVKDNALRVNTLSVSEARHVYEPGDAEPLQQPQPSQQYETRNSFYEDDFINAPFQGNAALECSGHNDAFSVGGSEISSQVIQSTLGEICTTFTDLRSPLSGRFMENLIQDTVKRTFATVNCNVPQKAFHSETRKTGATRIDGPVISSVSAMPNCQVESTKPDLPAFGFTKANRNFSGLRIFPQDNFCKNTLFDEEFSEDLATASVSQYQSFTVETPASMDEHLLRLLEDLVSQNTSFGCISSSTVHADLAFSPDTDANKRFSMSELPDVTPTSNNLALAMSWMLPTPPFLTSDMLPSGRSSHNSHPPQNSEGNVDVALGNNGYLVRSSEIAPELILRQNVDPTDHGKDTETATEAIIDSVLRSLDEETFKVCTLGNLTPLAQQGTGKLEIRNVIGIPAETFQESPSSIATMTPVKSVTWKLPCAKEIATSDPKTSATSATSAAETSARRSTGSIRYLRRAHSVDSGISNTSKNAGSRPLGQSRSWRDTARWKSFVAKLKTDCRQRGSLELDSLLGSFFDSEVFRLNRTALRDFHKLLRLDNFVVFSLLAGSQEEIPPELASNTALPLLLEFINPSHPFLFLRKR